MISRRQVLARAGALAALAMLPRQLRAMEQKPFPHPEARPGITAANVVAADLLPNKKRVLAAFDAARHNPELFDALYCVCECADGMKHRSLLACFESRQPVGCLGCQEQAEFTAELLEEGKTLAEIREATDKKWG